MKLVAYLIALLSFHSSFSQSVFLRTFGGTNDDEGWFLFEDATGKFVICGDTGGLPSQSINGNIYLLEIDSQGNQLWSKSYGDSADEIGRCVQPTLDGGYIVFGDHDLAPVSGTDALLLKVSGSGDSLWSVNYPGSNARRAGVSLVTLADSSFLLGSVNDNAATNNPYQIMKVDKNGAFKWPNYQDVISSTYFTAYGSSVKKTSNGGFIIGGTNEINFQTQDVIALSYADSSGNLVWSKEFTGSLNCDGNCIAVCSDGGFIIGGFTDSYGIGGQDMYLIKTDQYGDSVWAKTFGGSGDDIITAVEQTGDSGYAVFGYSDSQNGDNDIILLRLDQNGDSLWEKRFGGNGDDLANHGIICRDDGFAIVGSTTSSGAGHKDVLFIKADSLGNITTNINEKEIPSFSLYPNPFFDRINFTLDPTLTYRITVVDCLGQIVIHQTYSHCQEATVNTSNLFAGLYSVRKP